MTGFSKFSEPLRVPEDSRCQMMAVSISDLCSEIPPRKISRMSELSLYLPFWMYWMENLNMLLVWDMEPDIEPFICRCSHWPWGWLLENPACAGERLLGRRRRGMLNDWRYQPGDFVVRLETRTSVGLLCGLMMPTPLFIAYSFNYLFKYLNCS